MIDTGILQILLAAGGVTALVGTRIRPVHIRQEETLPAIAFRRSGGIRSLAHSGSANICESTYVVTCYATTAIEAKQVAAAVVAALHAYSGVISGETIFAAECTDEDDVFDEDLNEYWVELTFDITHKES